MFTIVIWSRFFCSHITATGESTPYYLDMDAVASSPCYHQLFTQLAALNRMLPFSLIEVICFTNDSEGRSSRIVSILLQETVLFLWFLSPTSELGISVFDCCEWWTRANCRLLVYHNLVFQRDKDYHFHKSWTQMFCQNHTPLPNKNAYKMCKVSVLGARLFFKNTVNMPYRLFY